MGVPPKGFSYPYCFAAACTRAHAFVVWTLPLPSRTRSRRGGLGRGRQISTFSLVRRPQLVACLVLGSVLQPPSRAAVALLHRPGREQTKRATSFVQSAASKHPVNARERHLRPKCGAQRTEEERRATIGSGIHRSWSWSWSWSCAGRGCWDICMHRPLATSARWTQSRWFSPVHVMW